jgi:DNA-binding CsgD family transcriptional regulator
MKPEYYLFTVFVFALLCVLLFLYRRFVVLPKGKKPTGEEAAQEREKEERLFRLYQNMEEMMDNFEGYIEDTRDQMDAMRAEMRQQQQQVEELVRKAEATEAKAIAAIEALRVRERHEPRQDAQPKAQDKPAGGRRGRQDAVQELLGKGMTVEQIAQKLEMSINEVKLVVYGMMSKTADKK